MTPTELKEVLKPHGLHVYADTGGIYTFMGKHFIASISGVDPNKLPVSIAVIRLTKNHMNTHPEYYKAIQTICAIHGIKCS